MRFFGESVPFGGSVEALEPFPERVGLLTVPQALADYATLIAHVKSDVNGGVHPDSPVIAVGGSLAGTLAASMRIKYPNVVDMALAASAPIFGYPSMTDQYGWMAVGTRAFAIQGGGAACPDAIRDGFAALMSAPLAAASKAGRACDPLRDEQQRWAMVQRIVGALSQMPEAAYPTKGSPLAAACAAAAAQPDPLLVPAAAASAWLPPCINVTLETLPSPAPRPATPASPASPTSTSSPGGSGGARRPTPPAAVLRARARLWEPGGRRGASGEGMRGRGNGTGPSAAAVPPAPEEPSDGGGLEWDYLALSEVVHPIGCNGETDMFPPAPWDQDSVVRWARYRWGVTPRMGWLPLHLGFDALLRLELAARGGRPTGTAAAPPPPGTPSRIIFSNGSLVGRTACRVSHEKPKRNPLDVPAPCASPLPSRTPPVPLPTC